MLKKEIDPCSAGVRCFIWDWWNCQYLWHVGLLLNQKGRVNTVNILHLDVTYNTVYNQEVELLSDILVVKVKIENLGTLDFSFHCYRWDGHLELFESQFQGKYLRKWYWECFGCCQTRFVSFIPTKKLSVSTERGSTMYYFKPLGWQRVWKNQIPNFLFNCLFLKKKLEFFFSVAIAT